MFQQMIKQLKREHPVAITGIYTQQDADRVRQYIRLAEAKTELPLSVLWTGTLSLTGEYTDKGRAVGKHGCKVFIDVARA